MYLRFVSGIRHPYADAELGIYIAADAVRRDDHPDWLQDAFLEALDGAFAGMRVPPCVGGAETRDGRRALSWLRADNAARVARMRHFAWVLGEMGLQVGMLKSRSPGRIIYCDADQVLAVPRQRIARAFPRRPHEPRGLRV
ncbi:MAG: hypothetical protein ACFBSD_15480 [Paracoccaceae bacterium]